MKSLSHRQKLLDNLRTNPIVRHACKAADIDHSTYYRWRKNRKFASKANHAIEEGEAFMNDFVESRFFKAIQEEKRWAIEKYMDRKHPKYKMKNAPDLVHTGDQPRSLAEGILFAIKKKKGLRV